MLFASQSLFRQRAHRSGHYTCLLKDGRITVRSATDDVFYIWGNDALENEQEKIDKIIANQKGEE